MINKKLRKNTRMRFLVETLKLLLRN